MFLIRLMDELREFIRAEWQGNFRDDDRRRALLMAVRDEINGILNGEKEL